MMHFLASIGAFAANLVAALLLVGIFALAYCRTTPYSEHEQLQRGNAAVAVAFGGALIGYAIVLSRAIAYSEWIGEMVLWGLIGLAVQVAGHYVLNRILPRLYVSIVEQGMAAGTITAAVSVMLGLITAACMTP